MKKNSNFTTHSCIGNPHSYTSDFLNKPIPHIMKGFVFTEFLEMVEDKFGFDVADKIVTESHLPSGGVYTSIGTYPHTEIVTLVVKLSEVTEIPVPDLLQVYGHHLFFLFSKSHAQFFEDVSGSFDFLEKIDNYIHVEVKKLYPEAELPKFEIERDDSKMEMIYMSSRKMSDLALGLIKGCLEYYEEKADIKMDNVKEDGSVVKFTIARHG